MTDNKSTTNQLPQYTIPRWLRPHWPTHNQTKANIASGLDYRPGWFNIDYAAPKVDKRLNLFKTPWPIKPDQFDFALLSHFIEHVPPRLNGHDEDGLIVLLRELARVLKPGAKAILRTPMREHGLGTLFHYRYFDLDTFNFLRDGTSDSGNEAQGIPLRLIHAGKGERSIRLGHWFDTRYHLPKYLGWRPMIGTAKEVIYVLQKGQRTETGVNWNW